MRRALVLFALGLAALAAAGAAYATWMADASGTGASGGLTLPGGNTPTVSAAADDVTVSWNQVTLAGSPLGTHAGGGYLITRYADGSSTPIAPGATCSGTISGSGATLTCTENAVPDGVWRYTVTPVLSNWRGAESAQSDIVTSDATPPTSSITFPLESVTYSSGGWMAGCGTVGTDDVCGTASDAGTGVQAVEVSLRLGSGNYWGGSAFDSATEMWFPAGGTTAWSWDFPSANFLIDGSYTLRSRATDNAGNQQSTPASATFTIDKTAPAIARVAVADATSNAAGFIKQGGGYFVYAEVADAGSGVATVTANVANLTTGAASVAMTTGGPWTIGGQSYNYRSAQQTADGVLPESGNPYSFTVDATDTVSNTNSLGGTVFVDNTEPATTASLNPVPNGAGWNKANVTVTLTATDGSGSGAASITYAASGAQTIGSTTVAGPSASFTISTEGITTISLHATDNVGNVESPDETQIVRLDKTDPSIAGVVVADSTNNAAGFVKTSDTYFIYAQVSDAISGVASVTGHATNLSTGAGSVAMTTTGGPWTIGGQSYNYRSAQLTARGTLTEAGNPHSFSVSATDTANNSSSLDGAALVDNTKPTTTASLNPLPNGAGWNNTNVTVTLTAADGSGSGAASIAYSASGAQTIGSTTVAGSSASFTISTEGTTTISFHAADNVGNVESPDKTQVVRLDKTSPSIARVVVADSTNNTADFFKQGGGYFAYAKVTEGGSGLTTLTANVGNITTGATAVSMSTAGGPWTIGGLTYDHRSALQTANGSLPESGNPHSFTVTATDTATNTASLGGVANVDNTTPTTTASLDPVPNGAGWNNADVTVTLSASDGGSGVKSITYSASGAQTIGSTTVSGAGTSFTVSAEGTTTVTFHATDNVGNAELPDKTQIVKVDKTNPSIARVVVADSTTDTAGFVKEGNAYYAYAQVTDAVSGVATVTADVGNLTSGATSVSMTTAGGPWTIGGQSYNYRSAQQTADGSLPESGNPYSFSVTATDNANNTSSLSGTASVDHTGPAIARVVVADATGNTAGFLRQGGGYFVHAQVTDPGSGVASVTADLGNLTSGATSVSMTTAGGPWTIGGQSYNYRSALQTADGSLPESGNPYAFTVNAADNEANPSSLGGSANVDNTQPASSASLDPLPDGSGWNNTNVTVTLSATDGGSGVGSITYSASGAQTIGSTTAPGSSTSFIISTDGTTTITFHATDNVGNIESPEQTQVVRLDKTGPSISRAVVADATSGTAGYVKQGGAYHLYAEVNDPGTGIATVTGDVGSLTTGASALAMTTSGGPWTIGGQSYNYRSDAQTANGSLPESGNPYSFSVHATDNLNNASSRAGTANVDNTGPAIARVVVADATNKAAGFFREGGGYHVYAQVTDPGSGVATVTGDVGNLTSDATAVAMTTTGGPWTVGGQSYNYRSAHQTADASVPEIGNPYSFTVHATDNLNNASSLAGSAMVDNTAPSIARVAVANSTNNAAVIRQGAGYFVYAQASDTGSGIAAVTADVSNLTTGATSVAMTTTGGPWTIAGETYNYRSAAETATDPLPESGNPYSFTVTATDNVGNASAAFGGSVNVDNTAPTASDVQATNDSLGLAGRAEQNDTITFTFSQQMDPNTIETGWDGLSTTVTVKLDRASANAPVLLTVWDAAGTAQLHLGSVNLVRSDYLQSGGSRQRVYSTSTMVQSGSTITITLGTGSGDNAATAGAASTMTWTPSTAAKDLAGNAMAATSVNESVTVADLEF